MKGIPSPLVGEMSILTPLRDYSSSGTSSGRCGPFGAGIKLALITSPFAKVGGNLMESL